MKRWITLVIFQMFCINFLFTQVEVLRNQKAYIPTVINFSNTNAIDWNPIVIQLQEAPKPASDFGERKRIVNAKHRFKARVNAKTETDFSAQIPIVTDTFRANSAQGVPNDNSIAVSDSGMIVSVVNTNIQVYNPSHVLVMSRSLASLGSVLGILTAVSDPRAMYDPVADRFIVLFFSGVTSSTSKIIIGFSQTNNPAGSWNFYKISGNYLQDSTWSDYPISAISDHDLFVTFNHLKDNEDWKTGFRYSAIWQIDKQKGYDGDSLEFNFWHSVSHQGKPIWSICPAQCGNFPSGNQSYFLSVRPSDLQNDTVFLHKISDSYQSGIANFNTTVLKATIPYGLPPNAWQFDGQRLATNDARVLSAIAQNDKVIYAQNCLADATLSSGIYIGEISSLQLNPSISSTVIGFDTIDLGYPSLCYIGENASDNRMLITCSSITENGYPSTSIFYRNNNGQFSTFSGVKRGVTAINVLVDSTERWGDYTGIQRKYNEPHTAWLSGSFTQNSSYRTCIAKVVNTDSASVASISNEYVAEPAILFPNPTEQRFTVRLNLEETQNLHFDLFSNEGKVLYNLLENKVKAGLSEFSFNCAQLTSGIYFLKITGDHFLHSERIIIQ